MRTARRNGLRAFTCFTGAIACAAGQAFAADGTPLIDSTSAGPPTAASAAPDLDQVYAQQFAAGNFGEAGDTAKRMLNELIVTEGDHLDFAAALEKLARAQHEAGDPTSAAQNYLGAVERIETAEDRLAPRLVAPLVGLAASLRESGAMAPAVKYYERAAHVSRVNQGPMNVAQCDILSELVEIYAEQARYDRALDIQSYQLEIFRRSYSDADPVVVDAWRRSGELLSLSGDHQNAQELYRHAMDLMRVADGSDSLAQLPLLEDLSESVLHYSIADDFTRIEMARAELERAVSITKSNETATPAQRADAQLRLGDFYQRFGEWHSALVSYREAWKVMAADPSGGELLKAAFDRPVPVKGGDTEKAGLATDPAASILTVRFDVSHRGRVDDVEILSDEVDDSMARKALAQTRKRLYRPRFEHGEPVATRGLLEEVLVIGR
jgi:tetratricopeptide (TPR) repeat protein